MLRANISPYRTPKSVRGVTAENLGSMLGLSQLLAPCKSAYTRVGTILFADRVQVAQLPYESKISGRTEYQPVTGSVLGHTGTDFALIELMQRAFRSAQWRAQVDTGRLTFPLGDNDRNVDDQHEDDETDVIDLVQDRGDIWTVLEL